MTESIQRWAKRQPDITKTGNPMRTSHETARTDGQPESSILKLGADQGAQLRQNSLTFPSALPFDAWCQIGKEIFSVANSCTWWIGDWLTYGENSFGDRYEQAIANTSLDYQTLRNYAWIAKKFA